MSAASRSSSSSRWAAKLGRTDLVGRQLSARGGVVRVGVRGDRVTLGGQAVRVLRGELG